MVDVFGNQVNLIYNATSTYRLDEVWLGTVKSGVTASDALLLDLTYPTDTTKHNLTSAILRYPKNYAQATLTWTFEADASTGRLTSVAYPNLAGQATPSRVSFVYNTKGNIASVTDQLGRTWQYEYDGNGRVTKVFAPGQTDPKLELKYSSPYSASSSKTWLMAYRDYAGYPLSDSTFKARATQYEYGQDFSNTNPRCAYRPLVSIREPEAVSAISNAVEPGQTELYKFTYTTGLIEHRIDRRGIKATYDWNDAQRTLASTKTVDTMDPLGTNRNYQTEYTYNAYGLPLTKKTTYWTGSNASVTTSSTETQYADPTGTLPTWTAVKVGNSAVKTTTNAYDANGRLTSSQVGNDAPTLYGWYFNPYNDQPGLVQDPNGSWTEASYDALGRKTQESRPYNPTDAPVYMSYAYDEWDRLTHTIFAGLYAESVYDACGNVLTQRDRNGNTDVYAYDAQNRRLTQTNAIATGSSVRTRYGYDAAGNLTSVAVEDPEASLSVLKTIGYGYDGRNRRTSTTLSDGTVERSHYDDNGNLDASKNGLDWITIYEYDGLNRLRKKTAPLDATQSDVTTVDYLQTATGLQTTSKIVHNRAVPGPSDATVTTVETTDLAGRLVSVEGTELSTLVSYLYDDAGQTGRRLSMTVGSSTVPADRQTWSYFYTNPDTGVTDGRLYRVDQTKGAPAAAKYRYNLDGTVAERESPGAGIRTRYGYDVTGRLTDLYHEGWTGSAWAPRQTLNYQIDGEGIPNGLTDVVPGGPSFTISYAHDGLDRLVGERVQDYGTGSHLLWQEYAYSKTGNRTSLTYRDGAGNATNAVGYTINPVSDRFASSTDGHTMAGYDANGRPGSLTLPSAGTAALRYDADDRLVQVGAHGTSPQANYLYDAGGDRVRQTVGTVVTTFAFDGDDAVAERNAPTGKWTFRLPGVGYVEDGAQFYERENAQGSVVSTVDASGAMVSRAFYDAYGVETGIQAGPRSRYGYVGRHGYAADGASGMLLCGARFYLPGVGRFLAPTGPAGTLTFLESGHRPRSYLDRCPARQRPCSPSSRSAPSISASRSSSPSRTSSPR